MEEEIVGWHQRLDGLSLNKLRELVMDMEAGMLQFMGLLNQIQLSDKLN